MRSALIDPGDARWRDVLAQTAYDVYHLPGYAALAARHEGGEGRALLVEDGGRTLLVPLVVRAIEGSWRDAASPYGYPGPLVTGGADREWLEAALASGAEHLRAEGVVTLFIRLHPLLNTTLPAGPGLVLHGNTVVIDLSLPEAELWRQTRSNHRIHINKARKAGDRAFIDEEWRYYEAFQIAYRATMERLDATSFYFFDDEYFRDLRTVMGGRMHLVAVTVGDELAGGCLITTTGGIVQYHLSATADGFSDRQPTKFAIDLARSWAKARGERWFHLGGGRGGQDDALLHFKAGFSDGRREFHTLRMILDRDANEDLCQRFAPRSDPSDLAGYFPVYRQR
jgi:hypothetical protein